MFLSNEQVQTHLLSNNIVLQLPSEEEQEADATLGQQESRTSQETNVLPASVDEERDDRPVSFVQSVDDTRDTSVSSPRDTEESKENATDKKFFFEPRTEILKLFMQSSAVAEEDNDADE